MTTKQERIRQAILATADQITPDSIPALDLHSATRARLGSGVAGRAGSPRRLLPAAAAATAVAMVLLGLVVAHVVLGPGAAHRGQQFSQASSSQVARELRRALRAWSSFPITRSPRPLVLVSPLINDPPAGFPSGAAKSAYLERDIVVRAVVPGGPARAGGYRLISARRAIAIFKSTAAKGPPSTVRLTITSVRLGASLFGTDRGARRLPAWLLRFGGISGAAAVLAMDPASIFSPPRAWASPLVTTARLAPDGRHLTVRFTGRPPGTGPCEAEYRADVAMSDKAVAVAVLARRHGRADAGVLCPSVGYLRQVTVGLSAPVGGRVVVDAASGTAVPVASGWYRYPALG